MYFIRRKTRIGLPVSCFLPSLSPVHRFQFTQRKEGEEKERKKQAKKNNGNTSLYTNESLVRFSFDCSFFFFFHSSVFNSLRSFIYSSVPPYYGLAYETKKSFAIFSLRLPLLAAPSPLREYVAPFRGVRLA